ncbi:MAG: RagB/SusD family nutrient uptake outer membrane protein, partial [Schleiferiaceae bacterium]
MKFAKSLALAAGVSLLAASCADDLNLKPKYGLTAEQVYADPNNYINVLAKIYAGLSISGNNGPAGMPDIGGIDEGFSQYVRVLWNLQQLPTDESICGWADPGIPELNTMDWNDNSPFVSAMYYRIYYQISLANEFIRYSNDDYLAGTSFSEADKAAIRQMNAEARYLRALSYYHALDLFGNVPFADESVRPGSEPPMQMERADLYAWVLDELNSIESLLPAARTAEYGRADQGALWALRAKLNLNAEVYTGTAKWAETMADCQRIIDAGYSLEPVYGFNFNADNHLSPEMIFVATFDGNRTRTY